MLYRGRYFTHFAEITKPVQPSAGTCRIPQNNQLRDRNAKPEMSCNIVSKWQVQVVVVIPGDQGCPNSTISVSDSVPRITAPPSLPTPTSRDRVLGCHKTYIWPNSCNFTCENSDLSLGSRGVRNFESHLARHMDTTLAMDARQDAIFQFNLTTCRTTTLSVSTCQSLELSERRRIEVNRNLI